MATYFGFEPSEALKAKIAAGRAALASDEKDLYKYRDDISHGIVHELIGYVLGDLIGVLPEGDKKNTLTKMVDVVDSTSQKLLNQILNKANNDETRSTFSFLEADTLNTDAKGIERIGYSMNAGLYNRMKAVFSEVNAGNGEAHRAELAEVFNDFTDATLEHSMLNFADSLKLGFIKRKLLPVAEAAISKGVKMGNKRLFPMLHQEEMMRLVAHYEQLIFEV